MTARATYRWCAICALGVLAFSLAQRWDVLSATPFPLGIDGYFYPVQLRSLLEHGHLQYPASPLGFWLLAPFAAATDPIVGAKLGAAVLGAAIAIPAYGVGARLACTGEDADHGAVGGLVAATLATTSAGSMYLSIEFVKNGIGLGIALTAVWLVLRACDRRARASRARIALAIAGLAAAVLTHKMAAVLALGIAIPVVLAEARARGALRGTRGLALVGAVLAAIAALGVAGVLAPRRFASLAELSLVEQLFTSHADWSLPALAGYLGLGDEPRIGVCVAVVTGAVLLVDRRWRRRDGVPADPAGIRVVRWWMIGLGLAIGLPWLDVSHTQGLGLRLRVIAFVPLACSAATVVGVVLRYLRPLLDRPPRSPAGEPPPRRFPVHAALGTALAAFVVALHTGGGPRTEGQVVTHPALVTSALALSDRLPPDAVAIVPERHIAFMIAWYARVPVALRPEGIAADRRWRVFPHAFVDRGPTLDRALIEIRTRTDLPPVIGLHPHHPNGMIAVPEITWQAVLATLPADERAVFERWPTI